MVGVGAEREYASRAPSAEVLNRLSAQVARRVPHLPGCASSGYFTTMGRFYLDVGGRPEWASIESDDPDEVLRLILVGEMVLHDAARELGIELLRANVDYRGATGACHFNISCTMDRGVMYDQLVPLLVALVVLGSGGLVPHDPGIVFSLSPRCSSYILKSISSSTDRERGLCHMRNEPLARSGWRTHIPGVDTTARPAESVRLRHPIAALREFCTDPSCQRTAVTVFNTHVTAIDILHVYLNTIRSRITRADSPDWLALACQRMQRVLDLIQADPCRVTCVDWCIKLNLFQDWARTQYGVEWVELSELPASAAPCFGRNSPGWTCAFPR
jgi:Pup amidohydrolase